MTIDELIERLEKAAGSDRELDLDILNATLNGDAPDWKWHDRWRETVTQEIYEPGASGNPVCSLDAFTSSIDAAMALVPEGFDYGLTHRKATNPTMKANAQCWTKAPASTVWGDAVTPAIALCIAALRARQTGETE